MPTLVVLLAALLLASAASRAADLVVWWEQGFSPEEDQAVRDIIAAFKDSSGKQTELVLQPQDELPTAIAQALAAGQPPDFLFGTIIGPLFNQWAYEGRLADLSEALGPLAAQFDDDTMGFVTMLDGRTGRRSVQAIPMGRLSNYVHVWRSLLERAGLTMQDIPKEWEAFWSFWCDRAQPALRKATGRNDVYGIGLTMSED